MYSMYSPKAPKFQGRFAHIRPQVSTPETVSCGAHSGPPFTGCHRLMPSSTVVFTIKQQAGWG